MDKTKLLHHVIDWADREQQKALSLSADAECQLGIKRLHILADRDKMINRSAVLVEVARLIHDWKD